MRLNNVALFLVCLLSAVALGQRVAKITSCTSELKESKCNEAFDGITTGSSNGWQFRKADSAQNAVYGIFYLEEPSDVSGISILSGVDKANGQFKDFSIHCYQQFTGVDVTNVRLLSGQNATIHDSAILMEDGFTHGAIRVDFDPVPACEAVLLWVWTTLADNEKYVLTELSIFTGTVFSKVAAPGECIAPGIHDIGKVFGSTPHTTQVRLTFPDSKPTSRQWILNLGQNGDGAEHWIWSSKLKIQFGSWGVSDIRQVDISQCTYLTTTYSGTVLKLYCDGIFLAERNMKLQIKSSRLNIGLKPYGNEVGFKGCISEVAVHSYEKSAAEVAQQNPPAFWKTCRWQSTQDDHLSDTKDLMGWTCGDNEILTGFGINANEDDVSKIQCCELGGHSSVVPNSCTFIQVGDSKFNSESATCNANDHMVFSGAYDKKHFQGDAFTEVAVGKCCEVKCDAPWCNESADWGVNTDKCQTISADPKYTGPQDLVCPEGTLLTRIHDGHKGGAHAIQKVQSVDCCELDLISQPSKAPTVSPTFPPSKAPTKAPTIAPSPLPTRAPSQMPSVAPTHTPECLLSFVTSDSLSDAEILQGIDSCLPCYAAPAPVELRKTAKRTGGPRRLLENAERN